MKPLPVAAHGVGVPPRHRPYEDVQALLTGTLFAAFGILMFNEAGLLAGGTVGLSLLVKYATGLDLSVALLLTNAPFYLLAWLRMGAEFTVKTFAAVGLAALFAWLLPKGLSFHQLSTLWAAVLGGLMAGAGMLILFRHRASLGGLNIIALLAQDRLGWRAGKVQMALDALIVVGGGMFVADAPRIAASVLAVVMVNVVLAVNHRPGRYMPTA